MQGSPGSAARLRLALGILGISAALAPSLRAQTLAPRAYLITPTHANAVTLSYSFYDGGLDLAAAFPTAGVTGKYNVPVLTYYHSFGLFGRSANITAALPYAVGNFQGEAVGKERSVYRSGMLDSALRFSVNLIGGPAMPPREFAKWRQKTLVGLSLQIVPPTGQYSSRSLINWGANRWAFKPELGYSKRCWGRWVLDAYGGAWFYTDNGSFFSIPIPRYQSQEPVGSFEGHWSYSIKNRTWASLDGNFWWGGTTTVNGIRNPATRQTSSRIGGTGAFAISKTQSIKVSYSDGTYIRYGGNYQSVSVAWQYSWIGRPK